MAAVAPPMDQAAATAAAPRQDGSTIPGTSGGGPIAIDTQHDDMVHDAQLDYYGCKLATASSGES